jgi:hypothetical protein
VEANAGTQQQQQSPAGGEQPVVQQQQTGNKNGSSTGAISKLRQDILKLCYQAAVPLETPTLFSR